MLYVVCVSRFVCVVWVSCLCGVCVCVWRVWFLYGCLFSVCFMCVMCCVCECVMCV